MKDFKTDIIQGEPIHGAEFGHNLKKKLQAEHQNIYKSKSRRNWSRFFQYKNFIFASLIVFLFAISISIFGFSQQESNLAQAQRDTILLSNMSHDSVATVDNMQIYRLSDGRKTLSPKDAIEYMHTHQPNVTSDKIDQYKITSDIQLMYYKNDHVIKIVMNNQQPVYIDMQSFLS